MQQYIFLLLLWLVQPVLYAASSVPARPASQQYLDRIRAAELAGDRTQVAEICRAWYASGDYSNALLNWNYNALMSLENGAVLLTQHDDDTYPIWLLQYALAVRPDVAVFNLPLLEQADYRERLRLQEPKFGYLPTGATLNDFLLNLLSAKATFPTYFGVMLEKKRLESGKQNLYLTGLALKYSPKPFDNVAVLRYNYENLFLTDYLKVDLQSEKEPAKAAQVNLNYIPAFLLLHRHYTAAGELDKAAVLQRLSSRIARANNREAEVNALFMTEKNDLVTGISAKKLEKSMKKVNERIYAAETETTNGQYEAFLQDLLKNKDFDQLAVCKTNKTDWRALLPDSLKNLSDAVIFQYAHPDDAEAPVQNITHEAAQKYCQWMTKVYNASTEKKKYKKVLFRLPTDSEWKMAAEGGFKQVPYPWGGYFTRNNKGCYLGNYNVTKPCGDCPQKGGPSNDGGVFTVKADSYFPNNFGLYNMSGNVAEMIEEPGKTKGGSWQDIEYYGQIEPVKSSTLPSPAVGFRVFMEIIEE